MVGVSMTNEELSYITGFLHGDGNNYKQSPGKGRISIELAMRDRDILDKIESIVIDAKRSERTRDTNFKKNYASCKLSIFKKELRELLDVPVGKKSKIIEPPVWIDERHYIRGLCDADGSIGMTATKPFWSLCTSSEKIKTLVLNKMRDVIGVEKRLNRNKRDNVYNIVIYAEDAISFAKYTYEDATIFLNRKYKEFKNISTWERTNKKRPGRKKAWLSHEDKIILSDLPIKDKMNILNRSKSSIFTRIWRLRQE